MDHLGVAVPDVVGVRHRYVKVGDLLVHIAEAGDLRAAPLVLVHGWPQNWFCWRHVVPLLSADYRLIMPDLRGHGWSDAPGDGYDKEQLATDLIGLLEALDLADVGLVGHDWGGWIGFLAALRAPERFSGLVALGILPPFQRLTIAKSLQAWRGTYQVMLSMPFLASAMLRASPRFVSAAIRCSTVNAENLTDADLRMYGTLFQQPARAAATVQMYRTFLLHELPTLGRYNDKQLSVKTRLVIGDRDPIGSPAMLTGWEANAHDMEVEVLPGFGHFLPEEAPTEVAVRIRSMFGEEQALYK